MSHAILTVSGWGLFYGGLILYILWVVAERSFFAGSDPERWSPEAHDTTGGRKPRPRVHFVSAAPLRRAA